jgi:hypothetical protein
MTGPWRIAPPETRDLCPLGQLTRIAPAEDHAAMNMQQPSRRVVAEPVPQPMQAAPKRDAPEPQAAREVPPTARSEPVGSS